MTIQTLWMMLLALVVIRRRSRPYTFLKLLCFRDCGGDYHIDDEPDDENDDG